MGAGVAGAPGKRLLHLPKGGLLVGREVGSWTMDYGASLEAEGWTRRLSPRV